MSIRRVCQTHVLAPAVGLLIPTSAPAAIPFQRALEQKPVLSTLLCNSSRLEQLAEVLGLTSQELGHLEALVREERLELMMLSEEVRPFLNDEQRTLEEKQALLQAIGYNPQVIDLARRSSRELSTLLGPSDMRLFMEWSSARWEADSHKTGLVYSMIQGQVAAVQYEVFATQYDAYTADEVAVPDKYVKFAAQGTQYASGYPADLNYKVTLERDSYSYTVRVYEVGPWNVDDNYWNAANDPDRPRRLFTDLPQGQPEAESAYYEDYNNGLDQYGRVVANPGGIDLALEVAPKLGLAYLENDWVVVTYLWETGSSSQVGNLVGYVREGDIYDGAPVAGASVTLGSGANTTADANGLYRFNGLPVGTYTVTAAAPCYTPASVTRTLSASIDTWASIALTPIEGCGDGGDGGCMVSSAWTAARLSTAVASSREPLSGASTGLLLGLGGLAIRRRRGGR